MFDNLTNENILLFAIKAYESPNCIMSEFDEDFKHVKYIKRIFKKYREDNVLKERLVLNHIICLGNVFGVENTTRILFFKIDEDDYSILKTFLLYLNYMPDVVFGINGKNIISEDLPVDLIVAKFLRSI